MENQQLLRIGILFAFIGALIIFISLITASAKEKEKDKGNFKFSVVGFFGFIPFGFGNDKRLLLFGTILTIVVAVATFILFTKNIKP